MTFNVRRVHALLTKSDLAHLNNLRTRSLLSFIAVCLQIPAGWALRSILDHETWGRRKRGLIGLTVVSLPLVAAWVWEMVREPLDFSPFLVEAEIVPVLTRVEIRTRNYNRNSPPADPTDWDEPRFAWIFILFMLNWVFSVSATGQEHREVIVILSNLMVNF